MDIQENVELAQYTTLRLGGPAQFFVSAKSTQEVVEAFEFAKKRSLKVFIIGGGSNVLARDEGFQGLVVKMENRNVQWEEKDKKNFVTAGAGVVWDELVIESVQKNMYGFENLSLIPGTVGATPVQNIGAYGVEVGSFIYEVTVFNSESGEIEILKKGECQFGYRDSIFKSAQGKKYVVLSVTFVLEKNGNININYVDLQEYFKEKDLSRPSILDVRKAVIEIRERKLPDMQIYGTAGSYFKNPIVEKKVATELKQKYPHMRQYVLNDKEVKISAAWLLENLGNWKGVIKEGVGVYEKHALILVTTEGATTKKFLILVEKIVTEIFRKTKITLEPEVVFVA